MPALKPTSFSGTITYLGRVPHRDAPEIVVLPLDEMELKPPWARLCKKKAPRDGGAFFR